MFLGNGAIFRNKKPAYISSIGIDLDTAVINEWEKLNYSGLTLINSDAISWLEYFSPMASILKSMGIRVFIYLDPPYPKTSRKNMNDLYTHEMTDADHTRLLTVARSIEANVLISSYPNDIYNKALTGWNTFKFQSTTRGGTATEQVWFNYPYPVELHDYRYIGNDYREREQLKGIVSRNVTKFKRLPDLHRNAIINELRKEKII